jgi:uncharacterized protein YeaO (DUF488 family)
MAGGRQEYTQSMAIRVVRLGTARHPAEGLRIGTVRRPPRGVPKSEYATRDYYDVWLPELAPSAPLVAWALSEPFTDKRWAEYAHKYRRELREPAADRLLTLLAALSATTNFSVGCYCADGKYCHRRLLRELLIEDGATVESG